MLHQLQACYVNPRIIFIYLYSGISFPQMLSGFLVKRLDNTYMFFHPSFREWLMRRDEGESTKFLCDYRLGHAAIAFRLSRLQAPLDGDKALELGHHVLKAHVYRGVAPCWPSRDLQVCHLLILLINTSVM